MADEQRVWKVPLLFVGLLSWFLLRNKTKHPILWIAFSIILVLDICTMYFRLANHHFLLTYMAFAVLMFQYYKRKDVLLKNIQMLLFVVISASVVQKLLSRQFMSGEFYYYMMNRGSLFRFFFNFSPEISEIISANRDSLMALKTTDPNLKESIVLNGVFPNSGVINLYYARITVIVELIVGIAILLKPKSTWTHLIFIVMILGILCTRFETGFMALLAVSGLFLCKNSLLKLVYVMIVLGCITLMITKIGYH
jgi:hypothetical protein